MKNATLILWVFCVLCISALRAQNVSGTLIDATNRQPIDGAFVTLLTKPQKTFLASGYTEADGKFLIEATTADSTFLSVNALGYRDTLLVIPPLQTGNFDLGSLFLPIDKEVMMDEVVVTAKPYNLSKGVDRIIMSLTDKNELVKNNTVFGMLRYTPMLVVDDVQGISMIGKQNLVVYINGRKTTMSAADVHTYLNSVPAENIKTIELITNPGSKFNVSAQTAVLNINLKRNEGDGLRGFASAQMWQTHYNKQIGSLNLNYAKGNFTMKTALTARNLADWSKSESETHFLKSDQLTERSSMSDNHRQIYQGNIDLAYALDKKQTLGAVVDFSLWTGKPKTNSTSRYSQAGTPQQVDSVFHSETNSNTSTGRVAVNLNYAINFNPKNKLAVDVDYQYYKMNQKEHYTSYEGEGTDRLLNGYYQKIPQDNDLWMGQAEYTTALADRHKLVIGTNLYSSASVNKNTFPELDRLSAQAYPDTRFDYDEKGAAGYLSYDSQWDDHFSSSVGLRFEHTRMEGDLKYPQPEAFTKDYDKWLPSLSFTYVPSQNLYLWYSLAAQSSFPSYEYLNPFRNYTTATSYTAGNPDLDPSLTYYQDLGCYLNGRYMFVLAYYVTKDAVEALTFVEGDNVEVTLPVNYGKKSGVNLTINANQSFFRGRWYLNATLLGQYVRYQSQYRNLDIDKDFFYAEMSIDNTVILSKKHAWKLLGNYQFRTPNEWLTGKTESDMRASIELRKDIKNWSLAASYYRSWNYNGEKYSSVGRRTYATPDYEQRTFRVGEYQGAMLKVSYNWGNKKVKSGKSHQAVSGNQKQRYGGNK